MKQSLLFLISILLFFLLIGCWDRQEINDIAIVTATSFDKLDENIYKIGTQIPLPGEMGGSGSHGGGGGTSGGGTFYLDAGNGKTVREANYDLQRRLSRKLIFGHRRVAIFGEDLAIEGLRKSLDVLTRTREARLTTQIFVSEGQAIEILGAKPQMENLSSEAVREIGVNSYHITLKDFLLEFQQKGNDPLLPVINLVKNTAPDPEMVENQIEIKKIAVFKGDRLDFITEPKQTSAVEWLLGKKKGTIYTIHWEQDTDISFRIKTSAIKITYQVENDAPVFHFNIDLEGSLIENETSLNFEEAHSLKRVNEKVEQEIENEVRLLLDEMFSRKIDSFGLGWLLHRRERTKWNDQWKENWNETLPTLKYEVHVNSSITLTGLITEGIGIGE